MFLELLQKTSLFSLLHRIDVDLSESHRQKKCPDCGGPLHRAYYQRKPWGALVDLPDEYSQRLGLCCGHEGCRRRQLPASCLFMDRKVFWRLTIVLVVAFRQQRTAGVSVGKVCRVLGCSRSTVARWMVYFREEFPRSPWWRRLRGLVPVTIRDDGLPGNLISFFLGCHCDTEDAVLRCLRFLATGRGGLPDQGD